MIIQPIGIGKKYRNQIIDRYPKWNFEDEWSFISDEEPDSLTCRYDMNGESNLICVVGLPDEWYTIELRHSDKRSYYKCDSIDGVWELLDEEYQRFKSIY